MAGTWWRDAVFYQVYVRSFVDSNGYGQSHVVIVRQVSPTQLQALVMTCGGTAIADQATRHLIGLAGGPIKGGQVVGESDEHGYAPKTRPVTPGEIAATLYKGLGIDPTPETNASVRDNLGRPYYIAGEKPNWIKELVG